MSRIWHRLLCIAFLVVALCGLGTPATIATAAAPDPFLPGEVVVKLRVATDLRAVAASHYLDPTPIEQFGARPIYRLRILDGAAPPQRAAAIMSDSRVLYAEPNFVSEGPEERQDSMWDGGVAVADFAAQWAPAAIRLPEALAVTRGAGITVAVLDTGVDATHPALAGHLVPGYDFVDMDNDPSEVGVAGVDRGFGHGTHVAGLVALAAPGAKIMPLRVLDQHGRGNIWVLAEALHYAINPDGDLGTVDGASVINLSLSTPLHSQLLQDVMASITCDNPSRTPTENLCAATGGRGAVVVTAAGNSGSTTPEYPAGEGMKGLFSVGATTQTDAIATFSNRGSWVNVAAPGDRIVSSVPGGYATWSGTSMAAPLVAGEAALVRAACPGMTSDQVEQQILGTATHLNGQIARRIDAAAAVKASCARGPGGP